MPAVSYYGGHSTTFLGEPLQAPMLFHFGADDPRIPPHDIQRHRLAPPGAGLHVYDGVGHAFNRDSRPHDHHHHPQAAALAWQHTLAFLAEHCVQSHPLRTEARPRRNATLQQKVPLR